MTNCAVLLAQIGGDGAPSSNPGIVLLGIADGVVMQVRLSFLLMLALSSLPVDCYGEPLNGHVEQTDVKRLPRPETALLNSSLEIKVLKSGESANAPLAGAIQTSDFYLPLKVQEPSIAPLAATRPRLVSTPPGFVDSYWLQGFEQRRGCCWPSTGDFGAQWVRERHRLFGQAAVPQTSAQMISSPLPSNWPTLPGIMQNANARQVLIYDERIVWNEWYNRVSEQIYSLWSRDKRRPGTARLTIVVTAGKEISASVQRSTSAAFSGPLLAAVSSLNQASVLQFPPNSRRRQVSFEATFTSGADAKPGVIRSDANDLETVRRSSI